MRWSARLKWAVEQVLASPMVATLACGPERALIYNDDAARLYGDRHPGALGRPLGEAFPDAYPIVAPLYDRVFAGESIHGPSQPLDTAGDGTPFVFDAYLSPVRDEDGAVVAALMVGVQVSARREAELALRESEERQAFFLKLSDSLRPLLDPVEIKREATRLLGGHFGVNRAFYADANETGDHWLVAKGFEEGVELLPEAPFPMAAYGQWIIEDFRAGKALIVRDMDTDPRFSEAERAAQQALQIKAAVAVPLVKAETLVAMLVLHAATPRDWTEQDFALLDEAAERTWAAVERARAEAALRTSEEKYRSLFVTMGQGYCELELVRDAEGRAVDQLYLELNPAFERLFGVPVTEARGRKASEVFPDLDPDWTQGFARVARIGTQERIEQPVGDRWFEVFAYPRGGDRVAVLYEDVTDRRRAADALRESEERQAFLLELSGALRAQSDATAMIGVAARLLGEKLKASRIMFAEFDEVRGVAEIFSGWFADGAVPFPTTMPLEEYKGPVVEHLLAGRAVRIDDTGSQSERPDLAAIAELGVKALLSIPVVVSGRMIVNLSVHQSAARRWSDTDAALAKEVVERLWADLVRMRAETALRDSEARFRQFSDASTNVLWIRDATTLQMLFVSPAFETIYGRTCDSPDDGESLRCWARMIVSEDRKRVLGNIRRVRSGERVEQEFRIRRASDGALRWVHNTDFPMFDGDGRIRWVAGLGSDITEIREATERQGVLVAELQHRTRNLIGVVRSLSDRTIDSASSMEDFGRRFALRLAALSRVQGLLSHLTAGEKVAFDDLLRSELAAHGATDGMAYKVTLEGRPGVPLRSSTVQTFALALHELATNAVKYGALAAANPDGHLTVRWHVEPAADRASSRLHVEWRESGVVMPHVGAPPRGGGYGRELIERALPYQLKAKTTYELGADGVRCTIAVPIFPPGGGGLSGGAPDRE